MKSFPKCLPFSFPLCVLNSTKPMGWGWNMEHQAFFFLTLYMCVFVNVWCPRVFVWLCECLRTDNLCAHTSWGQRLVLVIFFNGSLPYCLREGLWPSLGLMASWLYNELQGSICLCPFPQCRGYRQALACLAFMWVPETQRQVLMLVEQALY